MSEAVNKRRCRSWVDKPTTKPPLFLARVVCQRESGHPGKHRGSHLYHGVSAEWPRRKGSS